MRPLKRRGSGRRCCPGPRITALAGLKGANEDQNHGIQIALRAMEALREIVANAGDEPSVIINKVKEGTGSSATTPPPAEFGDMLQFGILDPTKVTSALQNAPRSLA